MNTDSQVPREVKEKRQKAAMLFNQLDGGKSKEAILAAYNRGSIKSLYSHELDELITRLNNLLTARKTGNESQLRIWRSNVLTVLTKLGVYKDGDSWPAVNAYLKDSRIAGKLLYEMSIAEMQALVPKLRSILNKQEVVQQKNKRLAALN